MMLRRMGRKIAAGHGQRLWPAFALLAAVVVLPTAGVFWFMNQAMQNEQLAMRQRLAELYRSQLRNAADQIQASWKKKFELLKYSVHEHPAPQTFSSLVSAGEVDSIIIYNKGRQIYPESIAFPVLAAEPHTADWLEARRLEFGKNDPGVAAAAYSVLARQSTNAQERALALVAEARCLNKSGKQSGAIDALTHLIDDSGYRNVKDAQGRSIQLNAQLFALQLMKNSSHPLFKKTAKVLIRRLNDYQETAIPSSQRRFLMQQVRSVWPDCPEFATLSAEELAANFAQSLPLQLASGRIQAVGVKDVWVYEEPDKSFIAFFSKARLLNFMEGAIAASKGVKGIRLKVIPPGTEGSWAQSESIDLVPSWTLALLLDREDLFQSAARQKTASYAWTGILMTAAIALLAIALTAYLRRQMRLTKLKSDLISTVSHELKTPLASMRLLIDTLRDGHCDDARLVQEYLQMIARENARLSSLIEDFLTFSRMERNKAKFERERLKVDEIIDVAIEAVGNRLQAPGCQFKADLKQPLPAIIGDRNALVTVFVNLLDNSLKYTGENKKICLRGFLSNGSVCIQVEDNGIGFPQNASKKIFERFYQVDRTLSRRTGGCGLGLSIVQFILSAHNGSIAAESRPEKGSMFTVLIPAAE
jgi:signal transduction histidine kinase